MDFDELELYTDTAFRGIREGIADQVEHYSTYSTRLADKSPVGLFHVKVDFQVGPG
jgi:hypothetical protein